MLCSVRSGANEPRYARAATFDAITVFGKHEQAPAPLGFSFEASS